MDFHFDSVAPITGDGVYRREDKEGQPRHALLCNPEAHTHQLAWFSRLS